MTFRGDAAVTAVDLKAEIEKITDQFNLQMADMENKGGNLLNDTGAKFQEMIDKFNALHEKTSKTFDDLYAKTTKSIFTRRWGCIIALLTNSFS